MLLLATHLIVLELRLLCLLNLDPAAVCEACFPWLKLRKPQPGPFPVLHTK